MNFLTKTTLYLIIFSLLFSPSYAFAKKKKEGQGYVGNLPVISKYFQYKQKSSTPVMDNNVITDPVSKENLIKGPTNDAVFVDVIVKKKKPSKYYDEILSIIPIAEKLRKITKEEGLNIQKYNSGVNTFDLYVTRLQRNYANKQESMTESYNMLQEVNYRAKVLGNLKYESNFYSKYKPVLEEEYTPEYLKMHDEILVKELDKTIFILQKESDDFQYEEQLKD